MQKPIHLSIALAALALGPGSGLAQAQGAAPGQPGAAQPARGMTMSRVESSFGAPSSRLAAVGQPPITRWEYPGFIVYFEHSHVIHTVTVRP